MKVLITAGNTLVPIDRVRAITNIFTGQTGARLAVHGYGRDHIITLLTSHPEVAAGLQHDTPDPERWQVVPYRTFDDLQQQMERLLRPGGVDVLIHCAAVSDYRAAGVYAPAPATRFRTDTLHWESSQGLPPALEDRSAGKVKSDEPELWLRLVRTPKLVDLVRGEWGFQGILVKFKLEVGVSEQQLLEVAERSRRQSEADLMVANTLDGATSWAYLGPLGGQYVRLERQQLPVRLFDAVEQFHKERRHG